MDIRKISKYYIDCFSEVHKRNNFQRETAVNVSSRVDSSVFLIGSTISVLKPHLFDKRNIVEKRYLIQPAIRTQQLRCMEKNMGTGSCYGSFFVAMGDLAPYSSLEGIFELSMDFFQKVFEMSEQKLMFRVSSKDEDLLTCCQKYRKCCKIEVDSQQKKYYQHHYGLDKEKIFGRNCNIAVAPKEDMEYKDIANIIVIEKEGQPFSVELAMGLSSLISHAFGFEHTMRGNIVADFLKMENQDDFWLGDCLSVIACLTLEGIRPNSSHMQGRILKRYNKVFDNLCLRMQYSEKEKQVMLSSYFDAYAEFVKLFA